MSGVGSVVEGEDLDTVLAQVTLVSGVTIGPQVHNDIEKNDVTCACRCYLCPYLFSPW